ncbi:MAG: DUF4339 domain-containing protein [Planctomycetota bacterium]|nr:DUF4339 domain-containing protein [Planctomycetota bacterium]
MAGSWYYESVGKPEGPVTTEVLRELVAAGKVSGDTRVWCKGMKGWTAASSVDGLMPNETDVPPPIAGPRPTLDIKAELGLSAPITVQYHDLRWEKYQDRKAASKRRKEFFRQNKRPWEVLGWVFVHIGLMVLLFFGAEFLINPDEKTFVLRVVVSTLGLMLVPILAWGYWTGRIQRAHRENVEFKKRFAEAKDSWN